MQPTIKILFTGLLNFYYDEAERKYEIGALMSDAHCLTIGISKIVSGQVAESKVLTHVTNPKDPAQVEIIETEQISIDVHKPNRGALPYPNEPQDAPPNIPNDLRHSPCIDGSSFHPAPLQGLRHVSNGFPKIIEINDGTFYSELHVEVIKEQGSGAAGNGAVLGNMEVAWYIGADIHLDAATNDFAVLKYRKNGVDEEYRMAPAANTSYAIFIENGCYPETIADTDYTDFDTYYEVFNIEPTQQFRLKIPPDARLRYQELERALACSNPIVILTRSRVWRQYDPPNCEANRLPRIQPGANVIIVAPYLTPDNLCIPGRTLNKYW